jgi:hypothetical protein
MGTTSECPKEWSRLYEISIGEDAGLRYRPIAPMAADVESRLALRQAIPLSASSIG